MALLRAISLDLLGLDYSKLVADLKGCGKTLLVELLNIA
jgi:hypothetical protein